MRAHDDWSVPALGLPPLASDTGPFTTAGFLSLWWEHRAPDDAELTLVEDGEGLLPLWAGDGGFAFLGEEDLVDYHSPLGRGADDLAAWVAASHDRPFRLDSLPEEAAAPIAEGLRRGGREVTMLEHESTAVVALPGSFDEYLEAIGKKERHELRRKRRRFESGVGPARLERRTDAGALEDFVRLHRMSPGEKGDFMTAAMAGFFAALLELPGARIHLLRGGDVVAAASIGFVHDGVYYLYNSGYDPELAAHSPGMVLLALLLEAAIMSGMRRFDFLKGDEPYKYRLGAQARPLYVVTAP